MLSKHLEDNPSISFVAISEPPWALRRGHSIPGFKNLRALAAVPEETLSVLLTRDALATIQVPICSNRIAITRLEFGLGKPLHLISAYIQPQTGLGWPRLKEWLRSVLPPTMGGPSFPLLIVGDFNSRHPLWGPPASPITNIAEDLIDTMDDLGLQLYNRFPSPATFTGSAGDSHIDLAMGRDLDARVSWWVRTDLESLSDHRIVETRIMMPRMPDLVPPRRCWRQARWPQISDAIQDRAPHLVSATALLSTPTAEAFEAQTNALEQALWQVAMPHVPLKRASSRRKHWWSTETESAHTALKRAKRKGEHHRRQFGHIPPSLQDAVNTARTRLQTLIRTRKRAAWREFLVDNSGCTRDLWQTFKRITKPSKAQNLAFLTTIEGEVLENPASISEGLFSKFFPPATAEEPLRNYAQTEPPPPVSVAEARRAFGDGRPYAAPGPDGLPKALTSCAFRHIPEVFAALATRSLQLGSLPCSWQRSQVVCIPKKPNPRNLLALLRPISLIGTVAKSVHQIVAERLAHHVETHGCLSNRQFGFRTHRGTSEALVSATNFIERNLECHQKVYGITLDIRAAFDSLWPSAVLDAMEQMHTPSYLLAWTQSFFRHREARLDIEGGSFTHCPRIGTPQGSPLSPLLFIIGINPILDLLESPGVLAQAYADDILLLGAAPTEQEVQLKLQHALDRMNNWAQDRGLHFAPEKCFQIRFARRRRRRRPSPRPLFLQGQQLPQKPAVLYLGVWLDETFEWSPQIHHAARKVRSWLELIRRMTGPSWGMLPEAVEKLVSRVIEPAAYYGAEVWQNGAYNDRKLAPLEKAMRQACLLLSGTFRTTSYPSAYTLAGVRPPPQQIIQQALYYDSRRRHKEPTDRLFHSPRTERAAGQSYRRIAWSRWLRAMPRRPLEIPPHKTHPWSPIPPHQLGLLAGTTQVPDEERPDWLLIVSTHNDRHRHRIGTSWGLLHRESRYGDCWWDPDWASPELSALSGLLDGLLKLRELTHQISPNTRQSLGVVLDSRKTQTAALRWTNVSTISCRIQEEILHWSLAGHLSFWSTSKWRPGLSPYMAEWRRAMNVTQDTGHAPKGLPPDRSWIKQRIATYLNAEALRDIKQRLTSYHLTDHLQHFRRGIFPGKYLDRMPASRLSQFAANHFPSKQYLFRFGALAESPYCACGRTLEDRDHLLLDCRLFHTARQKLKSQVDLPLTTASVFAFPKEVSEFVESISAAWLRSSRRWGASSPAHPSE